MGTVCSAALLGCLIDLDVLDDQVSGIKTLCIGIGFGVLQETEQELGGLDWPSCAGDTELLACRQQKPSDILLPICKNNQIYSPCAALPVPPA